VSHKEELDRVRSEMEAFASQAVAEKSEQLSATHAQEVETLNVAHNEELDRLRSELAVTEQLRNELQSVKDKLESQKMTMAAKFLRDVEGKSEALSASERKCKQLERQLAETLSQQDQSESIEVHINNSASNKDDLLRELEKTALLKQLKETKEALSLQQDKHGRSDDQLKQHMGSMTKQLQSFKKQLQSHVAERDQLRTELQQTKKELSRYKNNENQMRTVRPMKDVKVVEMKRDEALAETRREAIPQAPYDEKESDAARTPPRAKSLAIDTSSVGSLGLHERVETPSSARASSSAIMPSFTRYDSLKQRYLKKVRASPKTTDK